MGTRFSDLLGRDQPRREVQEFRRELLDRISPPFLVMGLVAIGLGSLSAFQHGQWYFGAVYITSYLVFVIVAVVLRRLPFIVRSAALLLGVSGVALAALGRLGLGGAGPLLLVASCGLTAYLHGVRASLVVAALALLAMGVFGVAITSGALVLPPTRLESSVHGIYWIVTALALAAIVSALVIPFQALRLRLEQSLDVEKQRAADLARSNTQLEREVGRRVDAEAALRASEERFRTIFETAAVSIWDEDISGLRQVVAELEATGIQDLRAHIEAHPEFVEQAARLVRIRDVNQMTLKLYGADSKGQLLGALDRVLVPNELDPFKEALIACLQGKNEFECTGANRTLDGRRLHVLLRATFPESEPTRALISVMDITGRRELERQLAQARKMEAIGTLAGGIAHDFNNLLMGVQGCASLMALDLAPDHPLQKQLQSIEDLVRSGAELTGQLLGFARGGRYQVRPLDLNQVVASALDVFGRAKKEIRVHRKLQDEPATVEADQGQIEQVLLNLYVNAWQAMPEGGDLFVETKAVTLEAEDLQPHGVPPGAYVAVAVADTGVGMDARTRQRLFEPFFTTKKMGRGTGLGLASAYGIVRNHGGFFTVESEEGNGAAFTFYLPASEKQPASTRSPRGEVEEGAGTLLLVDDEKIVLEVGRRMLERLGYRVITATSGEEAIRVFEARGDEIALVILDMIMPGMGGGEVFDRLKALRPDVRVVLSTGYSRNGRAEEILDRGCRGFLQKPFTLAKLSQELGEILKPGGRNQGVDRKQPC